MDSIREFELFFEQKKTKLACLCGSERSVPLRKYDRYGIAIQPSMCLDCGHIYSKYNLNEGDLSEFYRKHYRNVYTNGQGLTEDAIEQRLKTAKTEIFHHVSKFVQSFSDKTVYEWGSSGAWNLVPFKEAGARVKGFDLDEEFSEFGRVRFNIDVKTLKDTRDFQPELDGTADVVIANHVLEHILKPFDVLKALSSMLKKGGVLYLGLPFQEMSHRWGYKNYFHVAHIHYFSAPWFLTYTQSLGLDVLESEPKMGIVIFRVHKPGLADSQSGSFPKYRLSSLNQFMKMRLLAITDGVKKKIKRLTYKNVLNKIRKSLLSR